jgi:transcriptional regulator with XRE-family HTH domain
MATSAYDPRHEELVRRLREARQGRALTQTDVAAYLRLPQSVVSRLEAGQRKISAVELRDLAELLDTPMEQLVPPRKWRGSRKRAN